MITTIFKILIDIIAFIAAAFSAIFSAWLLMEGLTHLELTDLVADRQLIILYATINLLFVIAVIITIALLERKKHDN